jgi:hypothetical protein
MQICCGVVCFGLDSSIPRLLVGYPSTPSVCAGTHSVSSIAVGKCFHCRFRVFFICVSKFILFAAVVLANLSILFK